MKKIFCLTTYDIRKLDSGAPRSVYGSLGALVRAGAEVSCLIPSTEEFEETVTPGIRLYGAQCDVKDRMGALRRSLNLGLPYKFAKYHTPELKRQALKVIEAEGPDVLLIQGSHLGSLGLELKERLQLPVILRPHNLEFLLVDQYARAGSFLLRPLALWQARRTFKTELRLWDSCDKTLFISDGDFHRARFEMYGRTAERAELSYVYDGVEIPEDKVQQPAEEQSFLISGNLNVIQNRLSVKNFLTKIWYPFARQFSDQQVKLSICGTDQQTLTDTLSLSAKDLQLHRVSVVGRVENFQEEVRRHRFFVSPTIMGSGYRVKLVEAGAAGASMLVSDMDYVALSFLDDEQNCKKYHRYSLPGFIKAWQDYCRDSQQEFRSRQGMVTALVEKMNWSGHAESILSHMGNLS